MTEKLLHHAFLHCLVKLLAAALGLLLAGCEATQPGPAHAAPPRANQHEEPAHRAPAVVDLAGAVAAAPLPRGETRRVKVVMLTASWCEPCQRAKVALRDSQRIALTTEDYSRELHPWCQRLPAFTWYTPGGEWRVSYDWRGEDALYADIQRTLPQSAPQFGKANEVSICTSIAAEMRRRGIDAETEHRLDDGTRVDILTRDAAIEVDWAEKWAEGIGQALYYGVKTQRKPCVLLLLDEADDTRYVERLESVARQYGIQVLTRKVKRESETQAR